MLRLQLGLDPWFPKSFPIIDEPIGELLEFDSGLGHDLCLFLFGGVGVRNMFGGHHPGFEVFDCFGGEGGGFAASLRAGIVAVAHVSIAGGACDGFFRSRHGQ